MSTGCSWWRTLVVAVGIFRLVPVAMADVPQAVHFQGSLLDHEGVPVDSSMEMVFRLYDGPGEQALELWASETPLAVDVTQGVFNVELSSLAPNVFEAGEVFLGITVLPALEGEPSVEMQPRLKVTSVPFALVAGHATSADECAVSQAVSNVDFDVFVTEADLAGYCQAPCWT